MSQKKRNIATLLFGTFFICLAFLYLMPLFFLAGHWTNIFFILLYSIFGWIIWNKWRIMPRWSKWALSTIALQIVFSNAVSALTAFIYSKGHAVNTFLLNLSDIMRYPEVLYWRFTSQGRHFLEDNIYKARVYRWEFALVAVLNKIYACIIGVIFSIFARHKSRNK